MSARVLSAIAGKQPSGTGWVRAGCPFCEPRTGKADRKAALGANVRTGFFHCFKCSARGWLRDRAYAQREPTDLDVHTAGVHPPLFFYELFDGPGAGASCLDDARAYALGRGLSVETAREARVGACVAGKFAGRVVVPVFDEDGEWAWYVGRAWEPGVELKYRYPAGARGGVMYNEVALGVETDEPALIVEGAFDALHVWPHGVGLLGKPSSDQRRKVAEARRPVVVVLDGDAWEEGKVLAQLLHVDGARAGWVKLGPRVDPDEVPRAALLAAARASLEAPLDGVEVTWPRSA